MDRPRVNRASGALRFVDGMRMGLRATPPHRLVGPAASIADSGVLF